MTGRRRDHTDRDQPEPAHRDRPHEGGAGQGGGAARELEALIEPTTKEDGFVNYNLHHSTEDDGLFYLYENWESAEKLDAHLAAPHLVRFAGMLGDLLDENGLTIDRLKRIA